MDFDNQDLLRESVRAIIEASESLDGKFEIVSKPGCLVEEESLNEEGALKRRRSP